jgi:molybdopterin/thiamine biosynthesis adenylyltransferase
MDEALDPLRQNPSLLLHETEDGLALWVADRPSITIGGDFSPLLEVLALVDGRRDRREISEALRRTMSGADAAELIAFCENENLIKSTQERSGHLDPYSLTKWDRQISNFTTLQGVDDDLALRYQSRLAASHVLILGVGGVGSHLAASCAMTGIGQLSLVDFDEVELSNTSRQVLYRETDVGRPKLDVAVEELRQRNRNLRINAISREVRKPSDMTAVLTAAQKELGGVDLVLLAADQPRQSLPYIVDSVCVETRVPFLMMSPHDFSHVSIGPLVVPHRTESYAELVPPSTARVSDPRVAAINARFVANIMDPYNGLTAKMAMVEVIKFLTGYRPCAVLGRMLDLDTETWQVTAHDFGS